MQVIGENVMDALKQAQEALRHSVPKANHYQSAKDRHAKALQTVTGVLAKAGVQ